jgi:hypothetical protein
VPRRRWGEARWFRCDTSVAKRRKRKGFVYSPGTPEGRARRLAEMEWPDAIHDAHHGRTVKLRKLLLNMNLTLDDEDRRNDLVLLHDRCIHIAPGRGRKPGSIPPPFATVSQREVVASARVQRRKRRAQIGGRLPPGGLERVLTDTCTFYAEELGYRLAFNFDNALRELRRRPTWPKARK